MSIELTNSQKEALEGFQKFIEDIEKYDYPKKVFRLNGEAGTGKTFLMQEFANYLQDKRLSTSLIAFTGKAASRLIESTGLPACTIHRLIYFFGLDKEFFESSKEEEKAFEESKMLNIVKSRVLIIDEYSMLDTEMIKDLLMLEKILIFVGDLNQLPPVKSETITDEQFNELIGYEAPTYTLTEPVRHGINNPILDLARQIKLGNTGLLRDNFIVEESNYRVVIGKNPGLRPKDFGREDHIVITNTNACRKRINNLIRKALGFTAILHPDEKIIITKNNKSEKLWNGENYIITNDPNYPIGKIHEKFGIKYCSIWVDYYEGDYAYKKQIWVWLNPLETGDYQWQLNERYDKQEQYTLIKKLVCIAYGYAITCHKAQGSDWDTVYIQAYDNKYDRTRWLYTAITRAKNNVIIKI